MKAKKENTTMKFYLLPIIASFLLLFSCQTKSSSTIEVSELLKHKLPPKAIEVLENPEFVKTYQVSPYLQHDTEKLWRYSIVSKGPQLRDSQISELQTYLAGTTNYRFSPLKKFMFLPQYAFQFERHGERVFLFVNTKHCQLEFIYNEKGGMADCDSSIDLLKAIIEKIKF